MKGINEVGEKMGGGGAGLQVFRGSLGTMNSDQGWGFDWFDRG